MTLLSLNIVARIASTRLINKNDVKLFLSLKQLPARRNYSSLLTNKTMTVTAVGSRSAKVAPSLTVVPRQFLSTQEITKNLFLISEDNNRVVADPKSLRLKDQRDKPLVLVLAWLQAKHKHLKKYAELYTAQGFDVLIAEITPWQLLWPVKGSQVVASDILKFLHNNDSFSPMVVHGFSVGGYIWGEVMVHMAREMDKYKPTLDRICAQVWDSAADITEIPVGVPKALFPNNDTFQKALRSYMLYHMKTFHDAATVHYIRSSQIFHYTLLHAPALMYVSKTDPVGAERSNDSVRQDWESKGIPVTWKCWDRSPHVGHFRKHPEEYIQLLMGHLQSVNLLRNPEKLRAKL